MKINKEDTTYSNSMTFKLLQEMTNYSRYLRRKAERMEELNRLAVMYIHEGKISDTKQIDCARSCFNHSDLEPYEIFEKIFNN